MANTNAPRPDALEVAPEIDRERCTGCTQCLLICPVGAIERRGMRCFVSSEVCVRCGRCPTVCPNEAIETRG
ncbi:MAG: ferredoxin [Armatimonadia bacterium]|nr:ferredoxin [Armatimonadia bacterium]